MSLTFKEALNIEKIKELKNKFKNVSNKFSWLDFVCKPYNLTSINMAALINSFVNLSVYFIVDEIVGLIFFLGVATVTLFFNFVYLLHKKRASKINFSSFLNVKYIHYEKFLNKKIFNEINEIFSNLNQKEKELLELMFSTSSSEKPLLEDEHFLVNQILKNFLLTKTIKEIKNEKDVIFDYIRKNIKDKKTIENFLSLLNSQLNKEDLEEKNLEEKILREKILKVENRFNENNTQVKKKTLAIKNI